MIEIHINKDVGSYEAKFIGPFTMRQTICVAIAAPICWFIYTTVSPKVSGDAAGFLMFIPAVIAWIFGWTKPYGMRPEMFVRSIFINMVLAPANRKYKTDNTVNDVVYSMEEQQNLSESGVIIQQVPETAQSEHTKSSKKQKKPRYKVSKDAVR